MTNQSKKILVTGGAGYIGSHTLIELIAAGFTPVVYDNLSNSSPASLARVQQIVGQSIEFIEGDILDTQLLAKTFAAHDFTAVIHFAGLRRSVNRLPSHFGIIKTMSQARSIYSMR